MRPIILVIILLFLRVITYAQSGNCKPSVDLKVKFCYNNVGTDSSCKSCKDCWPTLIPLNDGLTIESFIVRAWGEGFEDDVYEAPVRGNLAENVRARQIIQMVRPGSSLQFLCIKARTSSGLVYILQELVIEIK